MENNDKNAVMDHEDIREVRGTLKFAETNIKVHITADSSAADVLKSVQDVYRHIQKQELGWRKTRLLLGHMLLVVQQRKLYEPDYPSFAAYSLAMAEKFKIKPNTPRSYMFVAKRLPNLDLIQASQIKTWNLTTLANAAPNIRPGRMPALLKQAEEMEVPEFRRYLEGQGLLVGGRAKLGARTAKYRIQINVNSKKLVAAWREYARAHKNGGEELIKRILQAAKEERDQTVDVNLPSAA